MLKKFLKGIVCAGVVGVLAVSSNNYNAGRFSIKISNLADVQEKAAEVSEYNFNMLEFANQVGALYLPDETDEAYSLQVEFDGNKVIDTYFGKLCIDICEGNMGKVILGTHDVDEKNELNVAGCVSRLKQAIKISDDFKANLFTENNSTKGNGLMYSMEKNFEMAKINSNILKELKSLLSFVGIDLKTF